MSQSETLLTCEDSAVQSGDKPCCMACCESIFGSGENNQNFIDCGAGCDNECRAPINLDICEDLGLNFSAGLPGINPLSDIEEALCCLFPENDEEAAFVQSVPLNSQSCTETNSPTESPTKLPTESPTKSPTRLPTESPIKSPETSVPTSPKEDSELEVTFIALIRFTMLRRKGKSSKSINNKQKTHKEVEIVEQQSSSRMTFPRLSLPIFTKKYKHKSILARDMDKGITRQEEEVPEFLKIFQHKKVPEKGGYVDPSIFKPEETKVKKVKKKKEENKDDSDVESIGFSVI
eukprot:snap_masked-scaffold_45-processed-gene-1.76-mRNA-1 protein AED:1.00 eAED:1.00 QI:0/0/0/0/1/1/2/0/290